MPVPHGILYYIGSKTRVDVPLDEELRTKTLQAIRTIRELSERDTPPEPLPAELRHRCFGCSLATVCQPEETLYCLDRPHLVQMGAGLPTTAFKISGVGVWHGGAQDAMYRPVGSIMRLRSVRAASFVCRLDPAVGPLRAE